MTAEVCSIGLIGLVSAALMQIVGHKYMKRDDFKNYAAALRDKSAKFKRLKVYRGLRGEVSAGGLGTGSSSG